MSIILLHLLLDDGNRTIVYLGGIHATWEGLYAGTRTAFQFALLVTGAGMVSLTTAPLRLANGVARLLRPLGKISRSVHQLPIMIAIILHFVRVLAEEADRLTMIQKMRGSALDSRNIFKRLKALLPVLAPLLRTSFHRADALAAGMEMRCYTGSGRSSLYESRFGVGGALLIAAAAAMIPAVLMIDRIC